MKPADSTPMTPAFRSKTKLHLFLSILIVAALLSVAVVAGGPPTLTNRALASGEMIDGGGYDYYYVTQSYCPNLFCIFVPVILNLLETE